MKEILINWYHQIVAYIPGLVGKLIFALIVLIVGMKLSGKISKLFKKSRFVSRIDLETASFLGSFINIALKALVIFIVVSILGVPASSIVAIVGSCGVAIGLALQGSLSNLAGGLMILIFKPFEIGEYIETDQASGTVTGIGIFYTTLQTPDNKKVVIPNSVVSNERVTNVSYYNTRRVDFKFDVDYSADVEKVKDILMDVMKSEKKILGDPASETMLGEYKDSALCVYARCWVKSEDYWDIYFSVNEKVKAAFEKENIQIPFNQLDVHIKQ